MRQVQQTRGQVGRCVVVGTQRRASDRFVGAACDLAAELRGVEGAKPASIRRRLGLLAREVDAR